ncbi:MAG: D-alanyl-D-alanine carboxypeptidase [Rhodospirillales bacterium]|nr:D-alanyl-D-alanine carboxypeptidase [Rhodospirillales bacterium]MBO6786873.1 D-alanyl-D-alanine carboxypeptidase [Rhodospirillales bacterium]
MQNIKTTTGTAIAAIALIAGALVIPANGAAQGIETQAREAILLDPQTDTVLLDKNGDVSMPPASMSKMMTIYMLFESLKDGRVSLEDKFRVSENAWRTGGAKSGSSTMFLPPNSEVKVEDLIRGIIVQSGNDACIVVAENLAGSEEAFAKRMTERARELGMMNSTFANATGWPHPDHRTTAHDLAILAERTINDFPEYFHYYAEREFTYNDIRQANRNPLLYGYAGADGMKTGHTEEAGYGLTGTATQGERRLIAVVNGLDSNRARGAEVARLLDWGFREFGNYALFKSGDTVEIAPVWLGTAPTVEMKITRDVYITMTRKARRNMKVTVRYASPIPAPIAAGQQIGTLTVEAPGFETIEAPLTAAADIGQLGMFGRLGAALEFLLWGESG